MLIDVIKEFSCLDSIWEEYIQFLEIKSFTEASHCLRDWFRTGFKKKVEKLDKNETERNILDT